MRTLKCQAEHGRAGDRVGLKVAIVGAGATGGFFGGLLARGGVDVTFIARGAQLEAIRSRGLRVESVDFGDFTIHPASATPTAAGPVDLVLVCVKSYALDGALPAIRALAGPGTVVVPVLNGVDAHRRIGEVVGASFVLPASARIESTVVEPGLIRHTSKGVHSITLGEADGTMSPRVAQVAKTLQRGGFNVVPSTTSVEEIWRKFVFMCGFSGVCAASRLPSGPILATAETRGLVIETMREVITVARAEGYAFGEEIVTQQLGFLEKRPWAFSSSMMRDVQAGRPIEIEALNGMAVRLAKKHGLDVPANRFIHACLKPFETGTPKAPETASPGPRAVMNK